MNYLAMLEHSYKKTVETSQLAPENRLEFLGDYVFDFTTYDGGMSAKFAEKAIEVCDAITKSDTYEYIKDHEQYQWFLLMCNMPFFSERLNWGTAIRGAWWESETLKSTGLWDGDEQIHELKFTGDEWKQFAGALVEFSKLDASPDLKDEAPWAKKPGP